MQGFQTFRGLPLPVVEVWTKIFHVCLLIVLVTTVEFRAISELYLFLQDIMLLFYLLWFLIHQSWSLYTETLEVNQFFFLVSCHICVIIITYLYALFR
jgi:hypothetical protein